MNMQFEPAPWDVMIRNLEKVDALLPKPLMCFRTTDDADTLDQALLNNGVRTVQLSRNGRVAFGKYLLEGKQYEVDVASLKNHLLRLSEISSTKFRLRAAHECARVGFYQAPPADIVAKLLFRANRALRKLGPFWSQILAGAVIIAIHPVYDGNGRLARYFWIKAFWQMGYDEPAIRKILGLYYGANSNWSSGVAHLDANTTLLSSGDFQPFLYRWKVIIKSFVQTSP